MFFQDVLYNHAPQFGKPTGARVGTAEIVCTLVSTSTSSASSPPTYPTASVLTGSNPIRSHHSTFAVTGGIRHLRERPRRDHRHRPEQHGKTVTGTLDL